MGLHDASVVCASGWLHVAMAVAWKPKIDSIMQSVLCVLRHESSRCPVMLCHPGPTRRHAYQIRYMDCKYNKITRNQYISVSTKTTLKEATELPPPPLISLRAES